MANQARIRIEAADVISHNCRVIYIAKDGTETDISSCVQRVEFVADVNHVNTAKLHVIMVDAYTEAELEDIVVRHVKREKWIPA